MIDKEKLKIEITWSGNNVGYMMTNDGETFEWNELTREEQIIILNGFAGGYNLFSRFLREE